MTPTFHVSSVADLKSLWRKRGQLRERLRMFPGATLIRDVAWNPNAKEVSAGMLGPRLRGSVRPGRSTEAQRSFRAIVRIGGGRRGVEPGCDRELVGVRDDLLGAHGTFRREAPDVTIGFDEPGGYQSRQEQFDLADDLVRRVFQSEQPDPREDRVNSSCRG